MYYETTFFYYYFKCYLYLDLLCTNNEFTIKGQVKKKLIIKDVQDYTQKKEKITLHQVGERGYHGTKTFTGFSFKQVLKKAQLPALLDSAILISSPDGYRSLLSYGEVFLSARGDRMLLANRLNNEKINPGGKYMFLIPDDFMADRWVKAVSNIQIFQP
ncbi:MAG TPA: molybdopterin-dependent oxidoreductase [Desulfohalobiaceae bacterium]|nr:molybdopterin-dependent oxidoreductase [Desulfohalobiaceae bacterium]